MDERRNYQRFAIWFPVTIEVSGREVWAICRDASAGGLLVSAVGLIEDGRDVTLRFRLKPAGTFVEHVVAGRVVRREMNDDDLLLAFPHRLALEFIDALPDLLSELEASAMEPI